MTTFDAHVNFGYCLVATAPSPATSGTSLIVTAGYGTTLPAPPFNMIVWPTGVAPIASNTEIIRVTAISTDTLTITRAQESTAARTIVVGDQMSVAITKKTITDLEAAVNGASPPLTNVFMVPTYTSSAFQTPNSSGSATVQIDSRRIVCQTGGTATSYIQNFVDWTSNTGAVIWDGNSWFACNFNPTVDGSDFDEFVGVGLVTGDGTGLTSMTGAHYGFRRTQTASGGVVMKVTCADGTTETTATITDIGSSSTNRLAAKKTGTSKIEFYVNQVLVATLTTHIPTGSLSTSNIPFQTFISNKSTAVAIQMVLHSFSFTQQEA